jgi:hypothetical protein
MSNLLHSVIDPKELERHLIELNQKKKELESIFDSLEQQFSGLDQIVSKQIEIWGLHNKEYFEKLTKELAVKGVNLTNEEQNELINAGSKISVLQEKLTILKRNGVDVDFPISDFLVAAYDAIVSAFSRTLQKIDNQAIKNLANDLDLLSEEKAARKSVHKQYLEQYQELDQTVSSLKNRAVSIKLFSSDQLEIIKANALTATTAQAPVLNTDLTLDSM